MSGTRRNRIIEKKSLPSFNDGEDFNLTRLVSTPSKKDSHLPSGPSSEALLAIRKANKDKIESKALDLGQEPGHNSQDSRVSVSKQAVKGTKVSEKTIQNYLKRGRGLNECYRREVGLPADQDTNPISFVNWLLSRKSGLKSSTWRSYRQSAYYFIEGFPTDDAQKAIYMLDSDILNTSREPKKYEKGEKIERKTSSLKEKRFPLEDWKKVIYYLRKFSKSKLSSVLEDWLWAGMLTGLRPNEWKMTDLEVKEIDNKTYIYLYVLSSKTTNGRGTGAVRTLDLSEFNQIQLSIIQRMVNRGRIWLLDGTYAEMQGQCSNLMYKVTSKIWPKRRYAYSLYSTRHQFIANMKSRVSNDDFAHIAAIVGHGTTATASTHYGKKRSAWSPSEIPNAPKPVPEEVAVVRDVIRLFNNRVKMEIDAGVRSKKNIPEFPIG